MKIFRSAIALISLAGALLLPALSADAQEARLVLKGHDPVAYFTEGKPTKGSPSYSYVWDEGRYHFASARHRDMFAADPERYAPQFGGYCTGSMARGGRHEGDPEAWIVRDGRLYVFGAVKFKEMAEKDPAYLPAKVQDARKNWPDRKPRAS
jgi:hypothetical protein